MSERINKTSICSVVFLDIIDYSKMSVSDQSDLKEHFNALISEAIKDVAQNDRILLDTGDGAAISLLGAPEEALFISMTIRDNILNHNNQFPDQQLFVRIGINLGPVRVVSDINGQPNIIGDGINVAQRVMSFAEPNQILVSRSYYEVTSRLTKEITGMFTYSGIKHDKHVREHEVYVIRPTDEVPSIAAPAPAIATNSAAPAPDTSTPPMGKKGWIILGLLLIGAVAAAFYWSAKTRTPEPVIEMPAVPASVLPLPDVPAMPPLAPVASPEPVTKTDSSSKKPAEKNRVKRKKAAKNDSNKGANPSGTAGKADNHVGSGNDTDTSHHPAAHKAEPATTQPATVEPKAKPDEKSGWDTFRESVKQGGKKECTQGEIALGQCKP
jgi:class 3 adenylate cyclase